MSDATIYNWKAKYGGLEVSEAKRLRALEDEDAKLKRLLAEAATAYELLETRRTQGKLLLIPNGGSA